MSLEWINETEVKEHLDNGNAIHYKIVNGTAYHFSTPDTVIRIIENARTSARDVRLRFCLGDVKDGRDWGDSDFNVGYIGRSTGTVKIPLVIAKSNSSGGPALLDNCIIRIERKCKGDRGYTEVYRHPNYHK